MELCINTEFPWASAYFQLMISKQDNVTHTHTFFSEPSSDKLYRHEIRLIYNNYITMRCNDCITMRCND